MKLNAKGQVTIPAQLRRQMGFTEGDEVEVLLQDEQLVIVKAEQASDNHTPGQRLAAHMWKRLDVNLSTDDMMHLLRGE